MQTVCRGLDVGLRGLIVVVAAIALAGGCAETRMPVIQLAPQVQRPAHCAVIFFADGLDYTRMRRQLAAGELPNIQQRFVRGGVEIEYAVTSLPSLTYPNAVSLVTGRFPGHHDIMGNRWFDRRTLTYPDYITAATYRDVNLHFTAPTIYEMLDDRFTVNVQLHTRRGVKCTLDNDIATGLDWLFGNFMAADTRVGTCVQDVAAMAARAGRWPTVTMFYFPGLDEIGHHLGPDSPQYAEAMRNFDAQVGRISGAIENAGLADSCCYVLVSDHCHNQCDPRRSNDLVNWLGQNRRLRIHDGPVSEPDYLVRLEYFNRFDAVVSNNAYRRLAIYLRGADGWNEPPDERSVLRVIQPLDGVALYDAPGVGLVCRRSGPEVIEVLSHDGVFHVERRIKNGEKLYRLNFDQSAAPGDHQPDPLEYGSDAQLARFVAAGWHGSREWLAATAHTRYPDFVPQVVEMFDSPRTGDIVAFAREGWHLNATDRGGHGTCLAEDMRVPFFFSGPGLPAGGKLPSARTVDLVPTLLDLLGEADRLAKFPPIDGVSLAAQLRAATPSGATTRPALDPQ